MSFDNYNEDLKILRQVFADVQNAPFIPSPLLTDATCNYYLKQIRTISKILLPSQDYNAYQNFMYDYAGFLLGYRSYTATDEQQRKILDILPPTKAFALDPWALFLMMTDYAENEKLRPYVNAIVADPNETNTMSLINYLNDNSYFGVCCSVAWYFGSDQLSKEKLVGLTDDEYNNFVEVIGINQRTIHYATYYILARSCYGATQDELDDAIPDELIPQTTTNLRDYCKQLYDETERTINEMQQKVGVAMSENDPNKTSVAKKDFSDLAENKVVSIFKYPSRLGVLLSDFVELAVAGNSKERIPIKAQIDAYNHKHNDSKLTELIIERVIAGFGELYNVDSTPVLSDVLVYDITLSNFSNLVFGYDAGGSEKLQVLHALRMLNDKYVISDKGTKKPKAVKLVTIQEFDGGGSLKLTLSKNIITTHILKLNGDGYTSIKKITKGQSESHFRNRIISSDNIGEEKLLFEMYNYGARSKAYIQNHKSEHRKRIIRLFEQFEKEGYLKSWKRYENEFGIMVYQWTKSTKILNEEFTYKETDNQD